MTDYETKKAILESSIVAGPDNSIGPDKLRGVIVSVTDQLDNDIQANESALNALNTDFNNLQAGFDDLQSQVPYNHSATIDPTVDDDGNNSSGNGVFSFTSKWLNSTSGDLFICESSTTGAASWVSIDFNATSLGALGLLNSVGSAQIDAESILTSKIANKAISLGKMADGTPGDIIYYGENGVITKLAKGTAGQFVKQGGDYPEWGDGAALYEHVGTADFTTDTSSVEFTNLSAFRDLRLVWTVTPKNDGGYLDLRTSTNNGSSYDSGAADYDWYQNYAYSSGNGQNADTADAALSITTGVGSASNEFASGITHLYNFNQSLHMHAVTSLFLADTVGRGYSITQTGRRLDTSARDALKIFFHNGDMSMGRFVIEGIRG